MSENVENTEMEVENSTEKSNEEVKKEEEGGEIVDTFNPEELLERLKTEWKPRNPSINPDKVIENSLSSYKSNTHLVVERELFGPKIVGIREVKKEYYQDSPTTSMSLLRKPTDSDDFIFGSSDNLPFQPGGLDPFVKKQAVSIDFEEEMKIIESGTGLLKLPAYLDVSQTKARSVSVDEVEKGEGSGEAGEEDEGEDDKGDVVRLDDVFEGNYGEFLSYFDDEEEIDKSKKKERKGEQPEVKVKGEEENAGLEGEGTEGVDSNEKTKVDELLTGVEDILSGKASSSGLFSGPAQQQGSSKKSTFEYAITKRLSSQHIKNNFHKYVPQMAMTWPFDLDDWQKESIIHIENGQNVFVAAHTSSGKTVAAEYAIALSKKHLTRSIYTSPIKTLSNQKFREFKEKFSDVGLITGDVQINPSGTCLIMTTEILRSMLYKGADITRDIEYVIFDEIHYINDLHRGVVWEEVIILLPKHITVIMLSATIPNTEEFADWIGRTRGRPVYIISTKKRPVPLEHFIFYNEKFFKIVDRGGEFLSRGYQSALSERRVLESKKKKKKKNFRQNRFSFQKTDWANVTEILARKRLLPTVVFSFSRRKCETLAYEMDVRIDLTKPHEKVQIRTFITKSIQTLSEQDRKLPEILEIKEVLVRGIGCHHSGLLPLVKEIVEILFSRGLCKILFATETFAMGVNMPAKTVIFNGTKKHDGIELRHIRSSEYIQMAGRAGRRGIDKYGHVLVNCEQEIMTDVMFRQLILGKSTELRSKFRLTFNMILNLFRVEEFRVEDMMKRSFSEAHNQKYSSSLGSISETNRKLVDVEDTLECLFSQDVVADPLKELGSYCDTVSRLKKRTKSVMWGVLDSKEKDKVFKVGTVVVVQDGRGGLRWAVVTHSPRGRVRRDNVFKAVALVLQKRIPFAYPTDTLMPHYSPHLLKSENEPEMQQLTVPFNRLVCVCKNTVHIQTVKDDEEKKMLHYRMAMLGLLKLWRGSALTFFDEKMVKKFRSVEMTEDFHVREQCIKTLLDERKFKCFGCVKMDEHFRLYVRQTKIKEKLKMIKFALSDENLELLPEFRQRVKVLQTLGYVDDKNGVLLKGRVATEVNACDSMIVTELLFQNFFNELSENEICAVLSCLICTQKNDEDVELNERMSYLSSRLYNCASKLNRIFRDCGLRIHDYLDRTVRVGLMQVAFDWCDGRAFSEIVYTTTVQTGTIVRNIIQLGQVIREVRNCARVVGDRVLMTKMDNVREKIKRDIVYAASLYLHD